MYPNLYWQHTVLRVCPHGTNSTPFCTLMLSFLTRFVKRRTGKKQDKNSAKSKRLCGKLPCASQKESLAEFRPKGRNKMLIYFIRRLRRPDRTAVSGFTAYGCRVPLAGKNTARLASVSFLRRAQKACAQSRCKTEKAESIDSAFSFTCSTRDAECRCKEGSGSSSRNQGRTRRRIRQESQSRRCRS